MRFNLDSNSRPNPLHFFFLRLINLILFLQLLVQLLDLIHFFEVEGLILNLSLQLIDSVEGRPLVVSFEVVYIDLQFIRYHHLLPFLLQAGKLQIQLFLTSFSEFPLLFNSGVKRPFQLLLLPLSLVLQLFLLGCLNEVFSFVDYVNYLTVGRIAYDLQVLNILKVLSELSQVFPLGMIELQKFLLFDKFVIQFFQILRFAWIFSLDQLYKPALELFRSLFDMLKRIDGEFSDPHLMALRVDMALETVFILALLPAQFAKMFEPLRHN